MVTTFPYFVLGMLVYATLELKIEKTEVFLMFIAAFCRMLVPGGGQVDITNGKFVFQCTEAYLIEDGKITTPVKGATLIGDGPTVLTKITMLGDDFAMDPGIGALRQGGPGRAGRRRPALGQDRRPDGGRDQRLTQYPCIPAESGDPGFFKSDAAEMLFRPAACRRL